MKETETVEAQTSPIQDTPICARCGLPVEGTPVQNLHGWEGRQRAIERTRWYCPNVERCVSRKWGHAA